MIQHMTSQKRSLFLWHHKHDVIIYDVTNRSYCLWRHKRFHYDLVLFYVLSITYTEVCAQGVIPIGNGYGRCNVKKEKVPGAIYLRRKSTRASVENRPMVVKIIPGFRVIFLQLFFSFKSTILSNCCLWVREHQFNLKGRAMFFFLEKQILSATLMGIFFLSIIW